MVNSMIEHVASVRLFVQFPRSPVLNGRTPGTAGKIPAIPPQLTDYEFWLYRFAGERFHALKCFFDARSDSSSYIAGLAVPTVATRRRVKYAAKSLHPA